MSKDLVLLAETVELASQVMILSGKASGVLLKGLLLIHGVGLVATQLLVLAAGSLNIAAAAVEFVLLLLEADLSISDLVGQVSIAVLLGLEVLAGVEVLGRQSIIVTAEGSAFG